MGGELYVFPSGMKKVESIDKDGDRWNGMAFNPDNLKCLLKEYAMEIIGESEWEDPDIRGKIPDKDFNVDQIIKPTIRNQLRAEQRERVGKI